MRPICKNMCQIIGDDAAGGEESSDDFGTLFNEDDLNALGSYY